MVLAGKLITELGIKTPGEKFFQLFATQLHEVQNVVERCHHTKLHEGEDWHHSDSVKHWTYVMDGKVHTCNEQVEEVDEQNKKITFKLFGGDIENYKVFKLILEVLNKADGSSAVRWTIDYEKNNEEVETPNGWMDYLSKGTRDIDGHLVKGEKVDGL
ncbi:putative START-like domain-containing protein [Medicago truncatula]|uniref:Polyketide cyclase/dehydrase and lipid transporter n=1 Tax=Medicago truncatula TaxID=3880 RepID=I3T217_MEDTR|nr:MLP-like protein 28 [Medicago truncatula]AFK46559.1 unknown [Medicago truncatula]AFK49062.1 unknown [Medicago truncatula]KEH19275.1 polyketide cyclase/dehydrase and lipid transporter [Medicago truncatula]RHN40540.1 putative START-like domain-containing protein [Medicago truncatula]